LLTSSGPFDIGHGDAAGQAGDRGLDGRIVEGVDIAGFLQVVFGGIHAAGDVHQQGEFERDRNSMGVRAESEHGGQCSGGGDFLHFHDLLL